MRSQPRCLDKLIFILLLIIPFSLSLAGCQAIENMNTKWTYYYYTARGEDKKIRDTVNGCLGAWGQGKFRAAYDYHSQSYKKKHTLAYFLRRHQKIDEWLGDPVASFSITQVYIYPDNPRKADLLVIYHSRKGGILKDLVSLRKEGENWKITDWWIKR